MKKEAMKKQQDITAQNRRASVTTASRDGVCEDTVAGEPRSSLSPDHGATEPASATGHSGTGLHASSLQSIEELVFVETTRDIRVTVMPEFLEDHSDPDRNVYAFAYTVTIENLSPATVQLISRHWIVNSGGAEYTQVKGDGVVGEQPVLEANDGFRYTSGTVIKDPVGSMQGTYTFTGSEGSQFNVTIPRFDLLYPHLLH